MRLVISLISIFALLIVAAVVGPNFVNWNKYKSQITSQVQNATGLNIEIAGDLSLGLLPSPHVEIKGLTVEAPLKKKFDNILTMKSAEVSVELMPLLKKEVKVKSISLIAPDIQIEIMADGRPSWTTDKLNSVKDAQDVAETTPAEEAKTPNKFMDSIALDRLEIKEGKLSFINHQTGASQYAKDVNVELKANSLNGPFDLKGDVVYQDKKIEIDASTGKLPKQDEGLTINAAVNLPDAQTSLNFNGVTSIKAPFDVQGKTKLNINSPAKLQEVTGVSLGGYNKSIALDGVLTANQKQASFNELKLALGDFVGNGKITVQNIDSKNPLIVTGNIKSSSMLNIDDFVPAKKVAQSSGLIKSANAAAQKSFIPQSLTLPMPINADMKFDLGGVKFQGNEIKGVFLDIKKDSKVIKTTFKAMELPGQGRVNGNATIAYAASSNSPKTGQVVYSDPNFSYSVNGQVNQLAAFFKSFAPKANTDAVTKLYNSAQFDLNGGLNGSAITLKDSVLKLDQMVVGLGGSYKPATTANGRARVSIDISADSLDLDRIMVAQGKKKTASTDGSSPKSAKEAVKPIQGFSLPMDLDFDVSLQKASINNADLNGLRLTGSMIGNALTLKTAAVNNFAGAAFNVKGKVANLQALSGIDLNVYTKTKNLGQLAKALKVDVSKLPAGLNALEANVSGTGATDKLNFKADVKALGGQLEAAGIATDLLGKPAYSNLSIGLKHPNLVKAIQAVSPGFKGQAGLQQAINYSSKADINGKAIKLSDMKVVFGDTNFAGNLDINSGAKPVSVRGNIAAGKIALDSLLGAKSSGGGSSAGGSSSASKSGGKWSTAPIDLSWMNSLDLDIDLSASSLTYGKWNFTKPSTDLKIGNGKMVVNGMKAGVFGGQATLSTQVNASPVSLSLKSGMNNINLQNLAGALSGSGKLKTSGTVNFDMDVKSTGGSANALVNALNGDANLNGTNVAIKGFDLAKLARGLATEEKLITSATSLVSGALNGGQTKFDTVKGDFKITKGITNITSMVMDSSDAVINTTGYADLPKWLINVDNKISLKSVTDLDPFSIKIKGSLSNPKTLGTNVIEDYISQKLKRKLGKELPGLLGEDTTEKLKKFGIVGEGGELDTKNLNPEKLINNFLKPKEKAAPTPVEPKAEPVESAPANEVAPAPKAEPAPAPAPKKIEKPEDAVKELLKGGDPEEAINNVLKGLF